jgi:hypothetical protein
VYARAWSARHKQPGQHRGPLTRAYLEVLEALLWGFHNSRDGRCFPSYETIAARAQCCRDTVYHAIKALEAAGILTWVNRMVRAQFREKDLFGKVVSRIRLIRTSNAYVFHDPLANAPHPNPQDRDRDGGRRMVDSGAFSSKSENPPGTQIQESYNLSVSAKDGETAPSSALARALKRLEGAIGVKVATT